jgi:hypothetical protein
MKRMSGSADPVLTIDLALAHGKIVAPLRGCIATGKAIKAAARTAIIAAFTRAF